ncbi:carbon-nitrogen hydrolase family protein [Nitriliruptoraceae bacterium ZYF776]|nr:carbon-nitrogen hydrolase family protein [Profundirhabdus halotolerans]
MGELRIGAIAAPFDRDVEAGFRRIASLLDEARRRDLGLVVLPEAAIGGYVADLHLGEGVEPPPALDPDGPEIARLVELAGELVVCAGYCEAGDDGRRYNAAVCVGRGEVLGRYRKVHQPLAEGAAYGAGDRFEAFDTPVGRLGMLICWDKGFAEAARTLALDGAEIIACLSAWPASRTHRAPRLIDDRWTRRFDLFDQARALDNQVVWVASNQSGSFGSLDFVGRAKVVGPGGDVLDVTPVDGGMAVASVDVAAELAAHRAGMCNLRDRRPDAYRLGAWAAPA